MLIEIVRATLDDKKRVEVAVRECGKHVKTYFDMYGVKDYYEKGHVWMAVADGDDTVLGFAVAIPLKRSPVTSLYEMGVIPAAQGMGLGRRILDAVSGGRPFRLVVDHDNEHAIRLYESYGIVKTTEEPEWTKSGKNQVYRMEGPQ